MSISDIRGENVSGLEALLAIDDVAQLLRVSESNVYRLIRTGDLARAKVRGRTLFDPEAVRRFIARWQNLSSPNDWQDHNGDMHDAVAEASQHA